MRKKRVIVVDDDDNVIALLKTFFEDRDYEVLSYNSPAHCPIYKQHEDCTLDDKCSDILMIDQKMPFMTGLEQLQRQQNNGCKLHNMNKTLMTGEKEQAVRDKADELGVNFLSKPFRIGDVKKWVDACEERIDRSEPVSSAHKMTE
ncbi:MAG: response regulator [Nitrospirota bacterium]|nr:MAG: response regulator [Nitrospirota bacterium]